MPRRPKKHRPSRGTRPISSLHRQTLIMVALSLGVSIGLLSVPLLRGASLLGLSTAREGGAVLPPAPPPAPLSCVLLTKLRSDVNLVATGVPFTVRFRGGCSVRLPGGQWLRPSQEVTQNDFTVRMTPEHELQIRAGENATAIAIVIDGKTSVFRVSHPRDPAISGYCCATRGSACTAMGDDTAAVGPSFPASQRCARTAGNANTWYDIGPGDVQEQVQNQCNDNCMPRCCIPNGGGDGIGQCAVTTDRVFCEGAQALPTRGVFVRDAASCGVLESNNCAPPEPRFYCDTGERADSPHREKGSCREVFPDSSGRYPDRTSGEYHNPDWESLPSCRLDCGYSYCIEIYGVRGCARRPLYVPPAEEGLCLNDPRFLERADAVILPGGMRELLPPFCPRSAALAGLRFGAIAVPGPLFGGAFATEADCTVACVQAPPPPRPVSIIPSPVLGPGPSPSSPPPAAVMPTR